MTEYTYFQGNTEHRDCFTPQPKTEWWLHLKGKGNPEINHKNDK